MPQKQLLWQWLQVLGLQGVAFAIAAATVALTANIVPPAVYGEYTLLLSVLQITSGLVFSWLNQSIFRFAREEFNATGSVWQTLNTALMFQCGLVMVLSILVWCLFIYRGEALGIHPFMLAILVAGLFPIVLTEAFSFACQASNRFSGYGAGQVLIKLGPFLAVLFFMSGHQATSAYLLFGALAGWMLSSAYLVCRLPAIAPKTVGFNFAILKQLIAYGWKLPFATISGIVVTWMGVWAIRYFQDIPSAGLYAWSTSLYSLIVGALMAYSAVIAPRMTDMRLSGSSANIAQTLRFAAAAALLAAALLPLALLLVRLAGLTIWPTQYAAAEIPFLVLIGALPAQVLSYTISPLLMAYQHAVGRVVAINIMAAGVNIIGNLVLIPFFGLLGAALAASLAVWSMALPLLWLSWRIASSDVSPSDLGRIAIGGLFAIGCSLAAALSPPIAGLAICFCALLTGLLLARYQQWFAPLLWLLPQLATLPNAVRRPLSNMIGWCAASPYRPGASTT